MTNAELQEQWMNKNKVKKCEDFIPSENVKKYSQGIYGFNTKTSANIPNLSTRRRLEKGTKKCNNCNENFYPKMTKIMGKVIESKLCEKCSGTTKYIRKKVKQFGGWEGYYSFENESKRLKEKLINLSSIDFEADDLEEQLQIRKRLYDITNNKLYKKGIESIQNKIDNKKETSITGYKFDF